MSVHAQLQRGTNNVGAPARRHHLFTGGHESRTHDTSLFKAAAAAVALLEIPYERIILERESEHRLEWKFERAREIFAQMIVDLMTTVAENFSRIENVLRIECTLDLAQDFKQFVAELVAHVFGARDADPVLGGERTFELPHQRGGLIGDLPEFSHVGSATSNEHRTDMAQRAPRRPRT